MKIFFLALITCVIFCYQCESVEVECQFDDYWFFDYTCGVLNMLLITSKDDREISSISGQHEDGYSDRDLKTFWSSGKVVKFFPRSLTNLFENIERVTIADAELEELSKEDLKEFGENLKVLWLWNNKIEKIDADLFEFNPNLVKIDLSRNQIKHIGDGAFNGLEKLKNLYSERNPCTGDEDKAVDNRLKVLEIIERVEGSCKDLSLTTVEPELAETTEVEPETTQTN